MSLLDQSSLRNRLLRRLAPKAFARLAPHLEPVAMRKGDILVASHQPYQHVTFPETGIGSIIAISSKGARAESGLFGHDGFSASGLVLGMESTPHECIVQVAGEGHRVPAQALREVLAESPELRDLLLRFVHILALQTSYTALSNAAHPINQRLARWLLMCHDRVVGDEVPLTHEFMAIMLAVRRTSVTTALHVLESHHLIATERGVITITSRKGLEEFADDAYGQPEVEYVRVLGPLR